MKIIDVSNVAARVKEDFDEEEYERDLKDNPKIKRRNKGGEMECDEEHKGEHSDDDERDNDAWESDDSDDSDDSDEDMGSKKINKKDKKLNVKANTI